MVQIIIFNAFFQHTFLLAMPCMKSTADTHSINDDLSYLSVAVKPCILNKHAQNRDSLIKNMLFAFFKLKLFFLKHRL